MKTTLFSILAFAGFALVSCSDDETTAPTEPKKAVIEIMIDSDCAHEASNVNIYVDDLLVGTTQPGSSPLSKEIPIGNHIIYAKSQEGVQWGPFTKYVGEGGLLQNLYCN